MSDKYKSILNSLDAQYDAEVRRDTGHHYAGVVSDTARLYRLLDRHEKLQADNKALELKLSQSVEREKKLRGCVEFYSRTRRRR